MSTTAGLFTWHELATRDPGRALAFYAQLFGWETAEDGVCAQAGQRFASVTTSTAPPQVPAFWLPFIAVAVAVAVAADDVAAKVEQACALGARLVRPPATLADPRGALVGLRAAEPSGAATLEAPRAGQFCWDELLTDDPESAAAFYAALLGYAIEPVDMGPLGVYRLLKRGDLPVAGVMKHPEGLHPHWIPYLAVDDVDAETRRAADLGAKVYFAGRDIPGVGRLSGIDDPTGAGVCLFRGAAGLRPARRR
jgi:predicted enzyme related to lactoylglutathione lyase